MTKDTFAKITGIVIDKLEGGYFHPNMRVANPDKFGAYHRSGETMFGLDRHAGHGLFYSSKRKTDDVLANLKYIENGSYQYKNDDAKEFWSLIDKANAKKNWAWNFKGGDLNGKLKDLASGIMYHQYNYLANKYLSDEAKAIVESDPRLVFHFSYATWNGSGWFAKFASDINSAVSKGITKPDQLVDVALASRIREGLKKGDPPNSLIAQGGKKIASFINDISITSIALREVKKKRWLLIVFALVAMALLGLTIYLLLRKKTKK